MGQQHDGRKAAGRVEVTVLRPSLLGKVRKGRREALQALGEPLASHRLALGAPPVSAATEETPVEADAARPPALGPLPGEARRGDPRAETSARPGDAAAPAAPRVRPGPPDPVRPGEKPAPARPRGTGFILSAVVDASPLRSAAVRVPRAFAPAGPAPRQRFPAEQRALFIGQLAHMLDAGVALPRALDALREQAPDAPSRAVLATLTDHLYQGRSLSGGMAAQGEAFTALQVGVVRAAESAGDLPGLLGRLAAHEESDRKLSLAVRSRLTYPVVVLSCAFTLVALLAQFLVAGIAPVLEHGGVRLPLATEALFALVRMEGEPVVWVPVAVALAMLGRFLIRWMRSAAGRRRMEAAARSVPLLGPLLRGLDEARAGEALAVVGRCGLPLLHGMRMVAGMFDGAMGTALQEAATRVQDGMPLAEAMRRSGGFSPAVIHMVAAGEESGRLPLLLEKAAAYQELAARTALESLAAALEPLTIAGLGVLVAGVILVAFAPLYQMIAGL